MTGLLRVDQRRGRYGDLVGGTGGQSEIAGIPVGATRRGSSDFPVDRRVTAVLPLSLLVTVNSAVHIQCRSKVAAIALVRISPYHSGSHALARIGQQQHPDLQTVIEGMGDHQR